MCEDAIKAMSQTAKASPTKRIADMTAYHTLFEKDVLGKSHHFDSPLDTVVSSTRGVALDPSAFSASKKHAWPVLSGIKSFAEPTWHSPSCEDINSVIGELVTLDGAC